ncbi:MAG: mannitol dehydrogenase family protein [Eubacteriales bacterium]|nr:mannitol dehydrogenase family protein [Eubacteriales bacterium]
MELKLKELKNTEAWEKAGIVLPGYEIEKIRAASKEKPLWVHFGIGNIFRVFLGGIADLLLEQGELDRGITCVETFDYDVVDKIYTPYDNLSLSVILHGDGTQEKKVLGSFAEVISARSEDAESFQRLKEIFALPDLQLVSFTITEKGYALQNADGTFSDIARKDMEEGPENARSAMAIVAAMLLERFREGGQPVALVSMDNCSRNGEKLRESILTVADEWKKRGYVDEKFVAYVSDENRVSFPWTMIDKITPRPSEKIAEELEAAGLQNMKPVITSKRTYIAPFVNAEGPQYLVMEDHFPNGRPAFEKAGVYMTDRETVNKSERMKVTVCLNPIHTALGPYGCILGYDLFSDEMKDEDMLRLARLVGYKEGMEVVPDPGILSPKAFLDECMNERFPNPYLGDTCLRLSTDASQGLGVRFGVTVKAYMEKYGDAKRLMGIPLAIAGWLRYLLGVDDEGNSYQLAPDPMAEEMKERLKGIVIGQPDSFTDQLKWILSNENVFFVNLYDAGIGELIEDIFREEIAGTGAVRKTLQKYLKKSLL